MNNDEKKWEILHSEYLIRRPWLTARRDHIRMPNGVENPEYYVLEYPDWVNVIAITSDGHFLMERQYRHGLQWTGYEIFGTKHTSLLEEVEFSVVSPMSSSIDWSLRAPLEPSNMLTWVDLEALVCSLFGLMLSYSWFMFSCCDDNCSCKVIFSEYT